MKNFFVTTLAFLMVAGLLAHERPVIGILTTPLTDIPSIYSPQNYSFLPYSYIQSLEAAGARVVPIPYDAPAENITFLLKQVNGVLFPGGGAALNYTDPETGVLGPSNITAAGEFVVSKIIEANNKGVHFPLLATCQGWEILVLAISKNYDILYCEYNDFRVSSPVQLAPAAYKSGPWSALPSRLQNLSETEPFYLYNHFNALLPEDFNQNKLLSNFFEITGISEPVLTDGPPFIATAQAKKYPIYGNQFHAEKNAFMWKNGTNVTHTLDSILATQHIANFFVNEARKNNNTFQSDDLLAQSLISSWPLTNVSPLSEAVDYAYVFPQVTAFPEVYPNLYSKKSSTE